MFTDLFSSFNHPVIGVIIFLIGATVGSFLNVVIYRLPLGLSVNDPKRSFCPKCKTTLPFTQNIPLLSWLIQRGKCRTCSEPIGVRYFFVELITAIVWLACWYFVEDVPTAVFYMILSSICLAITLIDVDQMIIPRELTIAGVLVVLLGGCLAPLHFGETVWSAGLLKAFIGAVVGWVTFLLLVLFGKALFGKRVLLFDEYKEWRIREPETDEEELIFMIDGEMIGWSDIFFRKTDKLILSQIESVVIDGEKREAKEIVIRDRYVMIDGERFSIEGLKSLDGRAKSVVIPREAMGMGDVDLMAVIGGALGASSLIMVVFVACMFSLVWALFNRVGFGKMMPFGPALIFGGVFWIVCGQELWKMYLDQLGG